MMYVEVVSILLYTERFYQDLLYITLMKGGQHDMTDYDKNITFDEIDQMCNCHLSSEQMLAIRNRDFILASKLGVSFDQYMSRISRNYTTRLRALAKI